MSSWPLPAPVRGSGAASLAVAAGAAERPPRWGQPAAGAVRAVESGKLYALPRPGPPPVYHGSSATFCRWYCAPWSVAAKAREAGRLFLGLVSVGSSRKLVEETAGPPQDGGSVDRIQAGTMLP